MNQQQIHDRLFALGEEIAAIRRREVERQAPERVQLQQQCGAVGHIFVDGLYFYGRQCAFCFAPEREQAKVF